MASPLRPLQIAIQRYPSTIMTETMSRMLGQDINLKTDRHNLSDREITPPALAPYLNSFVVTFLGW